ncbi:MAG: hypothetical protein D8M58_11870 [Calditrichaeota bacterium]|nr:MAG: hypothetical protein DWQ03_12655 [Calditrichota bacterium]MBL1206093.1 hypothetical protein [Calditrichota bacterium]
MLFFLLYTTVFSQSKEYTKVTVNLGSEIFENPLPYDEPFLLEGSVPEGISKIKLGYSQMPIFKLDSNKVNMLTTETATKLLSSIKGKKINNPVPYKNDVEKNKRIKEKLLEKGIDISLIEVFYGELDFTTPNTSYQSLLPYDTKYQITDYTLAALKKKEKKFTGNELKDFYIELSYIHTLLRQPIKEKSGMEKMIAKPLPLLNKDDVIKHSEVFVFSRIPNIQGNNNLMISRDQINKLKKWSYDEKNENIEAKKNIEKYVKSNIANNELLNTYLKQIIIKTYLNELEWEGKEKFKFKIDPLNHNQSYTFAFNYETEIKKTIFKIDQIEYVSGATTDAHNITTITPDPITEKSKKTITKIVQRKPEAPFEDYLNLELGYGFGKGINFLSSKGTTQYRYYSLVIHYYPFGPINESVSMRNLDLPQWGKKTLSVYGGVTISEVEKPFENQKNYLYKSTSSFGNPVVGIGAKGLPHLLILPISKCIIKKPIHPFFEIFYIPRLNLEYVNIRYKNITDNKYKRTWLPKWSITIDVDLKEYMSYLLSIFLPN